MQLIHSLKCQKFPQKLGPPKLLLLNRNIAILIYEHRGYANLKNITVLRNTVLCVKNSHL